MKLTSVFILITALSGCCTVDPHVDFECPERPLFATYSEDVWADLPLSVRLAITSDDSAMKEYILQCEERARIHNGGH